jgi:dolichol-phosphate mannosyltransferase
MKIDKNQSQAIDLSIVLPAYEEASNLAFLLPSLCEVLKNLNIYSEIIVVDAKKSCAATMEICSTYGVSYLMRQGGDLYSHAVKTGIAATKGERVIFMDADGSHAPSVITDLWSERYRAELVIASRYIAGGKTENPWILIFLSYLVNRVFRIVLNLKCHDVSNSFRLYRGDDLRSLKLECQNFDIIEEILVKISELSPHCRIKEIPCTFAKRKKGKTKRNLILFTMSYVATLVRLYSIKSKNSSAKVVSE